ncbi:MAG: FKBP-type peptidyl-prolyl cis-trans isomerase [Bacteroidota bacterium]|nr:FKBP-type peptidyl-prolyl cis-trans isomerase [Bacteroidota bacterium]
MFFLIVSCRDRQVVHKSITKPGKKEMADMNRFLVQRDKEVIENYIERKNLKLTESPTGLWYFIENEGSGDLLKENEKISMEYECSLLDGTVCYSSSTSGPKEVILGRTTIEPGMNEGFRLLKPGAEAIFILPPFLAYGMVGDGKKIPPRSIIVYRVRILEVEKLE